MENTKENLKVEDSSFKRGRRPRNASRNGRDMKEGETYKNRTRRKPVNGEETNNAIEKQERKQTRAPRRNTRIAPRGFEDVRFKKSPLKIIPLGGLLEIGKNITVFEYEDEIIIVDCGLAFPTEDMLGVDLVVADITYLEKNKDKIKGLFITHGHEDHIGGIPYLLRQINVPIYATRFTVGLIKNKLEEHRLLRSTRIYEVEQGSTIDAGKMKVEFIRTSHSIPDASCFAIYTPIGIVMHTGDFKIDYTPIDGQKLDFARLGEIGKKGVMLLMSDSTNAEREGFTRSESSIGEIFDEIFLHCKKRIVVATFASNVHRVQQVIDASVENNRKVAICGRSMVKIIETAVELGYMNIPKNTLIDIDLINKYPDENLTIITTGSQGEPMSALTRMAAGDHRKVKITPNDLVIISANPIPGNEKFVSKVIDDLMQIGAEVIYSSLADIHVSGHGCKEEQKLMLSLIKPKFFMPVHGEYRQLTAHAETAIKMGVPKENIFLMKNGFVLEVDTKEARISGTVPSGKIMVDGLGIGDVGNIVLKDRQHLAQDGLIVVVLAMNGETGKIVSGPEIISRGFVYVRESENLMEDIKYVLRRELAKIEDHNITDWGEIKGTIRDTLRDFLLQKNRRNPMVLPIILEV